MALGILFLFLYVRLLSLCLASTLLIPIIGGISTSSHQLAPRAQSQRHVETEVPRLVVYYQTTHDKKGKPVSMLPLITEKKIALTHLIVSAFHVKHPRDKGPIMLNDHEPRDSRYQTLWNETEVLRKAGVKILGMVGGAARGSYANNTLDAKDDDLFEAAYTPLQETIEEYELDGIDLDVEQSMSQEGITRLVQRLAEDFGDDFIITLAPVATAMMRPWSPGPLCSFSYGNLEQVAGELISFYNVQFYEGFGTLATTKSFDAVMAQGWLPEKIVAGQLTSRHAGSSGYVPLDTVKKTVALLRKNYHGFGGMMGWEYFGNHGEKEPWKWAQEVTAMLRPEDEVELRVTKEDADRLETAWANSIVLGEGDTVGDIKRDVFGSERGMMDYRKLVNA